MTRSHHETRGQSISFVSKTNVLTYALTTPSLQLYKVHKIPLIVNHQETRITPFTMRKTMHPLPQLESWEISILVHIQPPQEYGEIWESKQTRSAENHISLPKYQPEAIYFHLYESSMVPPTISTTCTSIKIINFQQKPSLKNRYNKLMHRKMTFIHSALVIASN